MEGPSLFLASEQLKPFSKKTVLKVAGNTKIGKERLKGKTVKEIFAWGKHLVFQFDEFALRVHFMLFGSFEAMVGKKSVTGDYKRSRETRLSLTFKNGDIKMFSCSLKYIESPKARDEYDFSVDVMSDEWNPKQALKKALEYPEEEIADVLLDQNIFAGVGNIIKNEILFMARVNPKKKVKDLTPKQLKDLVKRASDFSFQFYEWKKIFMLKKNLIFYRKSVCPVCGGKVYRETTGKRQRYSYICPVDQPL